MKETLNNLLEYQSLGREQARQILKSMAQGIYNPSQVAAFLTVYMMRSITVEEMEGFRDAMLELCLPVPFESFDGMDLCGTGGDGKDTFNISTLSSFVVAGAGQTVVKHGNYGVSSLCGSSNLLEYFGYRFTHHIDILRRSLEHAGICFLHAPLFHPAMKNVAPIRKELAVKTFFNMLGPMVNPAFPRKQLVGVFSLELARLYGYIYQKTDKQFAIIHSLDGYDEISLTGDFKVITPMGEHLWSPRELGLPQVAAANLAGGATIAESAKIFMQVLEGRATPAQEAAVIANAGMALYCADFSLGIPAAMDKARESLASGRALQAFQILMQINQKMPLS
jgi:anthranilate phosphoribosyltransferase